ncbi:MAG: hypothetical protein LBT30_08285 [Clostridiales bacterium]|jgi:hypothetical protein|nr:hypothetical protein [Clostridiales bacterium]
MIYFENAAVFACGLFITASVVWVTKNKPGYIYAVLTNSMVGGIIYAVSFAVAGIPRLSAFSSFLTGALGVIGFILSLL